MTPDMNPFPESADDATPVTVMLTDDQARRLEALIERVRARDPGADQNDLADRIFAAGLTAAECLDIRTTR